MGDWGFDRAQARWDSETPEDRHLRPRRYAEPDPDLDRERQMDMDEFDEGWPDERWDDD